MRKIVYLLSLVLLATLISCEEDDNEILNQDLKESQETKNPVISQEKLLKSHYYWRSYYTARSYFDTIIYENNRVKYNVPQDKYSYKYYENEIHVYYNWNNSYDDELAYIYKLNDKGYPIEINKVIPDSDLSGPETVIFHYDNSGFIIYKIIEDETPSSYSVDSIVYVNDGSNIIETVKYNVNGVEESHTYYEHDNKVNPYRGYILELLEVERFINKNNITYIENHWSTSTYVGRTYYEYIYNNYNLPIKMIMDNSEDGAFYYNYY